MVGIGEKMKKILIFVWLLMSVSIIAQSSIFNVNRMTILDNSRGEISKTIDTDLTMILTNNRLTLLGNDSKYYWDFIGDTYTETETTLYTSAYDNSGIKCRVWFKAYDTINCAFGIEYSDYSFLYLCTIQK